MIGTIGISCVQNCMATFWSWLPDGYSHILDCAPTPSTLAQSKERKGSNFAIWQPCFWWILSWCGRWGWRVPMSRCLRCRCRALLWRRRRWRRRRRGRGQRGNLQPLQWQHARAWDGGITLIETWNRLVSRSNFIFKTLGGPKLIRHPVDFVSIMYLWRRLFTITLVTQWKQGVPSVRRLGGVNLDF